MNHLIWVDIETTDLEPIQGSILELGLAITTAELDPIDQRSWIFGFHKESLGDVSDWSLKQHFASGLLPLCLASGNTNGEIQDDALATLRRWWRSEEVEGSTGPAAPPAMTGSTVHFDRGWLKHHLPALEAWFHYRNIDVSTVKNLAQLWYPELPAFKGRGIHRVREDIADSVAELQYYVDEGVIGNKLASGLVGVK